MFKNYFLFAFSLSQFPVFLFFHINVYRKVLCLVDLKWLWGEVIEETTV